MKRMMPFLKIMGIFSKNFRHANDGFAYENSQGKIVSTVNVGYSGNYWEIAMVATHPDYRRKGLAKKLVLKSLEHAKKHKAKKCVLEVLEENDPAYILYKKLGFTHFDTMMKLKLDKGKRNSTIEFELDDMQLRPPPPPSGVEFSSGPTHFTLKPDEEIRVNLIIKANPISEELIPFNTEITIFFNFNIVDEKGKTEGGVVF